MQADRIPYPFTNATQLSSDHAVSLDRVKVRVTHGSKLLHTTDILREE